MRVLAGSPTHLAAPIAPQRECISPLLVMAGQTTSGHCDFTRAYSVYITVYTKALLACCCAYSLCTYNTV